VDRNAGKYRLEAGPSKALNAAQQIDQLKSQINKRITSWIQFKEFYDHNMVQDVDAHGILRTGAINLCGLMMEQANMFAKFFIRFFQARLDAERGLSFKYDGFAIGKSHIKPVSTLTFIFDADDAQSSSAGVLTNAIVDIVNTKHSREAMYKNRKLRFDVKEPGSHNYGPSNVVIMHLP